MYLEIPDFKSSRGWLDKWKKSYNVKQLKVTGESADIRGETSYSWKERHPEIIRGYVRESIWNMDDTGVFGQALRVLEKGGNTQERHETGPCGFSCFCSLYMYQREAKKGQKIQGTYRSGIIKVCPISCCGHVVANATSTSRLLKMDDHDAVSDVERSINILTTQIAGKGIAIGKGQNYWQMF